MFHFFITPPPQKKKNSGYATACTYDFYGTECRLNGLASINVPCEIAVRYCNDIKEELTRRKNK
jgi:hypothetical protein